MMTDVDTSSAPSPTPPQAKLLPFFSIMLCAMVAEEYLITQCSNCAFLLLAVMNNFQMSVNRMFQTTFVRPIPGMAIPSLTTHLYYF